MRIRLPWLLVLAAGLVPAAQADPPKPSSFAPHTRRAHYGAPVQAPILKRRAHKPRPDPKLRDRGPSA